MLRRLLILRVAISGIAALPLGYLLDAAAFGSKGGPGFQTWVGRAAEGYNSAPLCVALGVILGILWHAYDVTNRATWRA